MLGPAMGSPGLALARPFRPVRVDDRAVPLLLALIVQCALRAAITSTREMVAGKSVDQFDRQAIFLFLALLNDGAAIGTEERRHGEPRGLL